MFYAIIDNMIQLMPEKIMIKVTFKDMTSIDNDFPMTTWEILVKTNFPKESTVACSEQNTASSHG